MRDNGGDGIADVQPRAAQGNGNSGEEEHADDSAAGSDSVGTADRPGRDIQGT